METNTVITEAKTTAPLPRTFCQVLHMVLSQSVIYSKLQRIEQTLLKLSYPNDNLFPQCRPVLPLPSPPASHHLQNTEPSLPAGGGMEQKFKISIQNYKQETLLMSSTRSVTGSLGRVLASSQNEALQAQKAHLQMQSLFLSSYTNHMNTYT